MPKRKVTKQLYRKNIWNRMIVREGIYLDKRQDRRFRRQIRRLQHAIREYCTEHPLFSKR